MHRRKRITWRFVILLCMMALLFVFGLISVAVLANRSIPVTGDYWTATFIVQTNTVLWNPYRNSLATQTAETSAKMP
jgi:hypothetical protein